MAITRKQSFRSRIFISFFAAFSFFAAATILFQYDREKKYRADQLENTLDNITTFAQKYIEHNQLYSKNQLNQIDSLLSILPLTSERLTVITLDGTVVYDSEVKDLSSMENHLMRAEVQKSLYSGHGSSIRESATTQQSYYYYSKSYPNYYIRTAVLYNVEIKDFLKTERIFFIFIGSLFILMWILLTQLTKRIGNFISQLRDFAVSAAVGEEIEKEPDFSDRELDVIGKKIVSIYNNLNKTKYALEVEKNKLFEHMNVLAEGIAFYTKKNELKLSNKHFIQYINFISEKTSLSVPSIFEIKALQPLVEFIQQKQSQNLYKLTELPAKSLTLFANEQYFSLKAIVFADKSFEIIINDITKLEKRRLLKQQLTSNIAHELKTPVTTMKGYLETLLYNENIPLEKQKHFLERAFQQSERLTELLNDISLLNNIEDAGDLFEFKKVNAQKLIAEVIESRATQLNDKEIKCTLEIGNDIEMNGNESLMVSCFQNLIENTIKYAGNKVEISIKNYHSDKKRHYFSYVDTGVGIPEEHQSRIFERFYRIDEGRSRQTGGTGLGLSIVKNAIILHGGEITVRNRKEGGVEFMFSFPRA